MKKCAGSRGDAMVLVICVMALVVALSLSLLLTTSIVIAESQQESSMEKCRILAVSLSQEMEDELLDANYNSFQSQAEETAGQDDSLWFYVKQTITSGTWPYFNEDERRHTKEWSYRTFQFTDLPEELPDAQIEVLLYWESSRDASSDYDGTPLHIIVTCTFDEQTCSINTEYTLDIKEVPDVEDTPYKIWKWSFNWRE